MENKRYYWLKLKEDFFNDKRIKKLRTIAGGDTYTIIYLKLQLLSLKDEGNLYFDNIEDTFIEELALEIDEEVEDVKVCMMYLIKTGLVQEISENEYSLPETKLSIGSETASTIRSRISREKQKMLQCNTNATKCNVDIDIEKDIDIDIDIDSSSISNINIYDYIEKNFGRTLSPIEYEQISKWDDTELTRYAIKVAVLGGKYNIKYIDRILQNYKKNSITSVQQAQEKEKEFQNRKNNISDEPKKYSEEWWDKI